MLNRPFSVAVFLIMSSGLLYCQAAHAKKMYRWVDENGKTYLSDQVPPEHAQYKRESLSNMGRVIEVTEQAKTKEQQALDDRLESLKKAQDKIIAKQRNQDKVLLSAYRSVNDMNLALTNKLLAVDSETKVFQNNLKQLESQLEKLLKTAAGHERNGEKIPPRLLKEIKTNKSHIESMQKEIGKQMEKKKLVKSSFEADIERYKFLTQSNTEEAQNLSSMSAELLAADALGLFQCRDDTECAKAWGIAHAYVREHSTTGIDIDNEKLMMTKEPANDNDLSLSISKIDSENKKQQIFLDIRCRQSSLGKELCADQKVKDIRTGFRSYVEKGLTEVK